MPIKIPNDTFAPTPRVRSRDWMRENIFTHEDGGGRPYAEGAYPHIGAPGGPCDALDQRSVQRIWLQWGSRLGKSFFGQCATLFKAEMTPGPMMHANADEKTAKEVVQRTYGMMRNTACLRKHLKHERKRRQDRVDFLRCKMFVAWSRSVSTLADKPVEFGHGGEIDKWSHDKTSKEADPLKLYLDRGKEFPTRKFVLEGTPTIKGQSRIEHGRIQSTNCRMFVPCPHCLKYQILTMAQLEWEKTAAGKSDKDLARRTALYRCESCAGEIHDQHRAWMIRRGVWCPEGCMVKDAEAAAIFEGDRKPWNGWSLAEWIEGTPARDGPDAGYQLSSLYALSLGWGDIAAEFVGSKDKPQDLRNFINQWLAETWEISARQQSWEDLGRRLILTSAPHGVVPRDFSLITCGCDRQGDKVVYVVDAWGDGHKSHTISYGERATLDDVFKEVLQATFAHEDGGEPLRLAFTLVDSGFHASGIYDFCSRVVSRGMMCLPCKGSSTALNAIYREATLGKETSFPGAPLIHVDTMTTQDWIETQLYKLVQGDIGCASLFNADLAQHQDFLEQMLNEVQVFELDKKNYGREVWQRKTDTIPNDFRDCRRYAYVAMLLHTRGAAIKPRQPVPVAKKTSAPNQGLRPDGRPWL